VPCEEGGEVMNACVQQAKKNPSLNGLQAGRVGNNLEQSVMEWKDQYKLTAAKEC
jgi:hypothetical protein